jgi:hypothetical protein
MRIPLNKLSRVYLPPQSINAAAATIKNRGMGDVIHKILQPIVKGTSFEGCKGCQKRREQLNKLIPFNP